MRTSQIALTLAIVVSLVSNLKRGSQWLAAFQDDSPELYNASSNANDTQPAEAKLYHFIHLINPYQVAKCQDPFCPYDQAQGLAVASMFRAQRKAKAEYNIQY